MKKQNDRGFTLVEMLVVIAIIAVLAAALLVSLKSLGEHGRKTKCKANLRSLAQGVINRVAEHQETMAALSYMYKEWDDDAFEYVWRHRRGWVSWLKNDGKEPEGALFGHDGQTPKPNARPKPRGFSQPTCFVGSGAQNGRNAIMYGELWNYAGQNMSIYLCPSHKHECPFHKKKFTATDGKKLVVCRSYAMNAYFGYGSTDTAWNDGFTTRGHGFGHPRLYDVNEPSRLMLFAEIDPCKTRDSVLNAWGADSSGSSRPAKSDKKYLEYYYNADGTLINPHPITVAPNISPQAPKWNETSWQNNERDSIGFNHRSQGKRYGHVVFLDGHVRELPEKMENENNRNPTLRAALGLW